MLTTLKKINPHAVIYRTYYQSNKTISRPPQSRESIPLIRYSISLWDDSKVVSSANRKLIKAEIVGKSFMYKRKRRGPRIEPWGTPDLIYFKHLAADPTHTYC
jgi:hypothetical protein